MRAFLHSDDLRDILVDISLDLQTFLLFDDTSLCQDTEISQ
jgi:hypothetical protein